MTTKEEVVAALNERLADPTISPDVFDDLVRRLKIIQETSD